MASFVEPKVEFSGLQKVSERAADLGGRCVEDRDYTVRYIVPTSLLRRLFAKWMLGSCLEKPSSIG